MEKVQEPIVNRKPATIGETLVCLDFNVGGRADVNFIKRQFSMIADYMNNTIADRQKQVEEKVKAYHQERISKLSEEELQQGRTSGAMTSQELSPELKEMYQKLSFAQQENDWALQQIKIAQMMCVGSLTRLPEQITSQ
jgi:hypothetical protein